MIEIIVFIIIIIAVSQNAKKKNRQRQTPPFTAQPKKPGVPTPPRSAQVSKSFAKRGRKKEAKASSSSPQTGASTAIRPKAEEPLETRTFIEPTKPYHPARNAGEPYEEWMPVPDGKRVCHCGYCGADNLIPRHSDPKNYTCYFCREEL